MFSVSSRILNESIIKRFVSKRVPSMYSDLKAAKFFKDRMEDGDVTSKPKASLFPKTITRYLIVADTMRSKGLVPIVHGQSLGWIVPQTISKVIGFDGLLCHRAVTPEWKSRALDVKSMAKKQIEINAKSSDFQIWWRRKVGFFSKEKNFSNCSFIDHKLHIRPYLMAGTIGAFHSLLDESPFSFVFGTSVSVRYSMGAGYLRREYPGNQSVLPEGCSLGIRNGIIEHNMKLKGYSDVQTALLLDKIDSIYDRCRKASIGQLIVVGVPESLLDEYAYSCLRGGIPTGESVQNAMQRKGHSQVRLILDGDLLSNHQVEMVNIMDLKEVEEYSKDHIPDILDIEAALKEVCPGEKETLEEETALKEIKEIQEDLYQVASDLLLQSKKNSPIDKRSKKGEI